MAERSGIKTITTAGTAERLHSDLPIYAAVMVKALTTNTGLIYVGDVNGDVASTNGLPLAAGDAVVFDFIGNLRDLWVDSSVNGEKVSWLLLNF